VDNIGVEAMVTESPGGPLASIRRVLEHAVQLTTRRRWFVLLLAVLPKAAIARPTLGDDEWMRRFREFVKSFNAFVNALNDGSFDVSRWQRMRADWKQLTAE
jgi:hypothetical protein